MTADIKYSILETQEIDIRLSPDTGRKFRPPIWALPRQKRTLADSVPRLRQLGATVEGYESKRASRGIVPRHQHFQHEPIDRRKIVREDQRALPGTLKYFLYWPLPPRPARTIPRGQSRKSALQAARNDVIGDPVAGTGDGKVQFVLARPNFNKREIQL